MKILWTEGSVHNPGYLSETSCAFIYLVKNKIEYRLNVRYLDNFLGTFVLCTAGEEAFIADQKSGSI